MPETAVILQAPSGEASGDLLGLSFLERAVHTAAASGVKRVLIARREGSAPPPGAWRRSAKIEKIAPLFLDPDDAEALQDLEETGDGAVLVLDERTVFSPLLVANARQAGVGGRECAVFRGPEERAAGLGICPAHRLPSLLRQWREKGPGPWDEGLESPVVLPLAGGFAVYAGGAGDCEEARRRLLASVRKKTDGFVSRHLNRPLSLRLSRLFIRLGVTPNQISVGNLLLGLVGAWAAAAGSYWSILVGGLLFQASSVIDGSDGEVAKLTFNASDRGSWIDTVCDELTMLAFFTALPVGVYRLTGDPVYLKLVLLTLVSAGCLYLLMIRYVRLRGSHGSMVQILDDFRARADEPGLLGSITAVVSSLDFVVRRDFFSFLIFILCLFGMAPSVVWLLAVLVTGAAVFFAAFSRGGPEGTAATRTGGDGPAALYRLRSAVSRFVLPNSPSASSIPFVEYLKWYRYTRFTPSYPHSLDIQTRSGCNARCAFCGVGREKNRMHGRMSDDLFRSVIDEALTWPALRQINPYLLNDPLIDLKIEERIEYITSRRGAGRRPLVRIITNAGMLKRERAYRLLRSGLDELNISFNSIVPEVYEKAMRPLRFEKVMGNIDGLLAERDRLGGRGPKISVWTVLTREVEANLANERDFWRRRGVSFKARKLDNRASEEVEGAALGGRPLGAVQFCPIPFWRAWIMWNGDMIMCCVDGERTQVLGNCTERTIREIWNDRPYRELRRRWRERNLEGLICRGCKGS